MQQTRVTLEQNEIPTHWYNVVADMPNPPLPPLAPDGNPVSPEQMLAIFPGNLLEQEMSAERWIPIPEEVREIYSLWRPTPLIRATRLEKVLGTPCKIFFKYEGVSPSGSHKTNTSVPQAYYNKQAGFSRLTTETGAGQWGSALSFAGQMYGMDIRIYMVKISYEQKPYRRSMMQTWGANVFPSPTDMTNAGRDALAKDPNNQGSLGLAISEAVEEAASRPDTNYSLGSVLNHVLLHQTVIGQEAMAQLEMADDYPDVIVGATGGGSNFAGIVFPFIGAKLRGGTDVRIVAVEPAACPSLTRGTYAYDFGDTGHMTPLTKMHTLGSTFMPPGFHAGGLRYHGMAPMVSHLKELGLIEARALMQRDCFDAGVQFARAEGILPAPEANHAVRGAIDEAIRCREEGVSRAILFNLCGHGHFDMQAYMDYFAGKLVNQTYDESELAMALAGLPSVNA